MGLERLSMALKGIKSTYEIEIFKSIMADISKISGKNLKFSDFFEISRENSRKSEKIAFL